MVLPEIIIVCGVVLSSCPAEFSRGAVYLPPGGRFSSYNLTPAGGYLRGFCFMNRHNQGALVRVTEWTNEKIVVEASQGMGTCQPKFTRRKYHGH